MPPLPQDPVFFWQNTLTISVVGSLLLPVSAAIVGLIIGLYFRKMVKEAALHLLFFLIFVAYWVATVWSPAAYGCDHTSYCYRYLWLGGIIFAQLVWLFLRFLLVEHAGAEQVHVQPRRKWWW